MINLLFIGDKIQKKNFKFITYNLKNYLKVAFCSDNKYKFGDEDCDILLIENNNAEKILGENIIIVFDENAKINKNLTIDKNAICIVDTQNKEALSYLRNNGHKTFTCGLSQKDTLTLSSVTMDSVAVSLQRSVETEKGNIIEPCEIPLYMGQNVNRNAVLLFVAIMILSDNIEKIKDINNK